MKQWGLASRLLKPFPFSLSKIKTKKQSNSTCSHDPMSNKQANKQQLTCTNDGGVKKQKLTHNQATCTNDSNAKEPNFLVQRYRFNTVALPAASLIGSSQLAQSGAFQGIFSVALKAPHDPNNPSLLVFDRGVEETSGDSGTAGGTDDPFFQVATSALPRGGPVQQFYTTTKTVVYTKCSDDDDTVEVDFSFHNGYQGNSNSSSGFDSDITTGGHTTASTFAGGGASESHAIPGTSDIMEFITSRDQLATMVANRGGYLELKANPDPAYGASVCVGFDIPDHLKLYCVIASKPKPLPTVTEQLQLTGVHFRKPDAISFWTLMLGTHERLGANAPYFLNIEGLNRNVFSYLRLKCDFASLEHRVATWMLNSPYPTSLWGNCNAKDLVREYRRFLLLKTRAEDWTSQRLSPPMQNDAMTGYRLLDEGRFDVCTV